MENQNPTDGNFESNNNQQINKEDNRPQLSLLQSLIDIFFEPGKVFLDLRRYPRFLVAGLISVFLATAFGFAAVQKVGQERIAREQFSSPFMEQMMPEEARNKAIEDAKNASLAGHLLNSFFGFIGFWIFLFLCGLLYFAGALIFGGKANFWQGLSVTVYSLFPVIVIAMIGNFIVLFFKSANEISLADTQRGFIQLNPSMFINGKDSPVLATLLGSIDLFQVWGIVLATIGLKYVTKISGGSAFAVVFFVWILGLLLKVLMASLFGSPL